MLLSRQAFFLYIHAQLYILTIYAVYTFSMLRIGRERIEQYVEDCR